MSDLNGPNPESGEDHCSADPECWKCLAIVGVGMLFLIGMIVVWT